EVQRLLRSGQSQTRLRNGKIAVLDPDALEDFEQVLRDADPRQSQPGVYRLRTIQAAYLKNTAEEIGAKLIGASAAWRERSVPDVLAVVGPGSGTLRAYKLSGVA